MKRREFLRMLLLSGIFSLFRREVRAQKKGEKPDGLKEAMFWRRLDNE